MKQGHLLDDLCGEVAMPTTPTGFAGVDGRTGHAVDRINLALIEMLRKDSANDAAKLNDKGGVSRERYASRLNIHYTYLVKCCAATLSNWDAYFEARRGGLKPIARAFVDAVKADLVSGKSLAIVGNNIRISTYAERLGFSRGAIIKSLGPNLYRLKAELADLGVFPAQPVITGRTSTVERNKKAAIDAQLCENQAAALQVILIEDDKGAALQLNDRFQVDQTYYAAALDIKKLCPRALEVIKQWNKSLKKRHEGLSPVGKKFLAAIEVDRASADGVAASEQRNIDLHYYAKKLGVSVVGIRYSLGEKLSTISNSLRDEGALRTDLDKRLLAIIDAELDEGKKPVIGRGGKLDYPHYARLLNVKPYRLHSSIVVDELNSKYGSTSKVEARLNEMRLWLEKNYEKKTLRIRNGQLDRKQFQDAFNLKGGSYLVRYAGIRALFDEFDERILAENYRPAQLDNDLCRLIDLLRTDPELNRNQLTVNRTQLAKRLGIPLHVLREGAFDHEIRLHDERIHHRAEKSLADPLIAGRIFLFSDLPSKWSRSFLEALGSQFKKAFGHVTERDLLKSKYLSLHNLLDWVAASNLAVCQKVIRSATKGRIGTSEDWGRTLFAYREHLVSEIQQRRSTKVRVNTILSKLRAVLTELEPVLPSLQTELPGIKHARTYTVHRSSVAEATTVNDVSEKYIDFAKSMLRQAADRYQVDIEDSEAFAFTDALAAEMERSNDLPDDPAHAILLVLDRRLSAMRDNALRIFELAKLDLQRGHELLKQAQINGREFYQLFAQLPCNSAAAREYLRNSFPDPVKLIGTKAEEALVRGRANLLAIAVDEFDGFLPGVGHERVANEVGQFFQKRYLELGGKNLLDPLLNPCRDATGAALTLYLIESGANVSVGRTLNADCIEPASLSGYKLITGHKARAKGKPIYAELPSGSPAVLAIEWYSEHSHRFRIHAPVEEKHSLFLQKVGERCQLATSHWYTSWFKSFAREIPELAGASVTPSMIRPSVLLKAALENDGRLQVGRAIGQHSQAVTRGYQEKLPIRLLRDQHIRRFQHHFETRVLHNVVDVAQSLGISAEEFEQRIHDMQATGLGTFCADPYARPGDVGQRCQKMDCWRECPQLLIVANVQAIALLQIWQRSLEEARGDWERDHPERWGDVWLPWLCLTEVVQKRMSRGPLLLVWREAEKRAVELRSGPNFVPPRPF